MKKINLSRLAILGCCMALITIASAAQTFGQSSPIITTQQLRAIPSQSPIPNSGTMLVRTNDGIFMNIHTSGLVPGTVATAWVVIFNTPAACATNPCTPADIPNPATHGSSLNAGGQIVGADGTATFGGFRAIGDLTGIFQGTRGLLLPLTAEIHLVVRTHGTASTDPNVLAQQLSMFNGGCPPNICTSIQTTVNQQ